MNRAKTKLINAVVIIALIASAFCNIGGGTAFAETPEKNSSEINSGAGVVSSLPKYVTYKSGFQSNNISLEEIEINAAAYSNASGTLSVNQHGTLDTDSDSSVTWSFNVPNSGFYGLKIDYFPTISKGGAIERTVYIDGCVPYREASYIQFSRIYKDGKITENAKGNEVTPEQIESPRWLTYILSDPSGFTKEALTIYLTGGIHTLTLEANKEKLELSKITFFESEEPAEYNKYKKSFKKDSINNTESIILEAEAATEKSDFTVYAASDKSSSATTPQHPVKARLNMIPGTKWSKTGQWLSWETNIPESGFYYIVPRYKQDSYEGGFVSRKIYIDGKCPFKEAEQLKFNYSSSWTTTPLGGEEPYLFYLEKGKRTIKMEVVPGEMSDIITKAQDALTALNADYRRILMITGSSPDIYRDYGFDKLIPEVLEDFNAQSQALSEVIKELQSKTAVKGDFTNSINKIIIILEQIGKDPEIISELFATFKDNLASLGTWLQSVTAQPLDLDKFYLVPESTEIPDSGDGFFSNLLFKIKGFFLSFFEDYQSFASDITQEDYKKGNVLSVWMSTGREQCQIMQKLTEQFFTPETGIKVNIQLVTPSALLPAALAGTGPDVAMNVPSSTPIDFAIRGAAVDLSKFSGYEEVNKRFHNAATVPFNFNDAVYAVPETMTFLMMFYRTDILGDLGLTAPKTWDEFYEVVWELQQQNLDVGFPINAKTSVISNVNLYGIELFLYQQGGSLYNENYTKTAMTQDLNVECFEKMSELFTLYKFPVDYDFANRFRSGEMPLGIVEYTMYNQLTIFASEIKGLWAMSPVPGTILDDGSVNTTSPAASTGIMMLKSAADYDKAWQFIEWATRTKTQSRYATEVESVLGAAAKHATANVEAVESMSWTKSEITALNQQMKNLKGTPEVPGGYYTARAVDFAFAAVYAGGEQPDSALLSHTKTINDEIARKRKEFGMDY